MGLKTGVTIRKSTSYFVCFDYFCIIFCRFYLVVQ